MYVSKYMVMGINSATLFENRMLRGPLWAYDEEVTRGRGMGSNMTKHYSGEQIEENECAGHMSCIYREKNL